MAKKQSRKSVSLQNALYIAIVSHAENLGISVAEYVSRLVRADLAVAGIIVPMIRPHKSGLRADDVQVPPTVAEAAVVPMGMDAKTAAALAHVRAKLAKGESVAPKNHECWWCGDLFTKHSVIDIYMNGRHEHKVHDYCKRDIKKLPGSIAAMVDG